MLGKNVIVLLISSFSLWSGNTFAQNTSCAISMNDVFIPGILSIGSYSQLIESQGYPNSSFPSTVNPINSLCIKECGFVPPSNVVQCEYLVYDAFEYIHIGDSVQLVFIDLRKTIFPIFIKDFVINRTVSQKEFLYKIKTLFLKN